jgi:hypothetical protein
MEIGPSSRSTASTHEPILPSCDETDGRARSRERAGGLPPEAARGPGHDRGLALQSEELGNPLHGS